MRSVTFTVPGRIGGKGRHRSFMRGNKVIHAAHQPTESMEGVIKHFAHQAMVKQKMPLLSGALGLTVMMYRSYPKSWSARQISRSNYVTGKPDYDNICKLIGDSLNGIMYRDDSQIANASFTRIYRLGMDEAEETQITVRELEDQFEKPRQKRTNFGGPA